MTAPSPTSSSEASSACPWRPCSAGRRKSRTHVAHHHESGARRRIRRPVEPRPVRAGHPCDGECRIRTARIGTEAVPSTRVGGVATTTDFASEKRRGTESPQTPDATCYSGVRNDPVARAARRQGGTVGWEFSAGGVRTSSEQTLVPASGNRPESAACIGCFARRFVPPRARGWRGVGRRHSTMPRRRGRGEGGITKRKDGRWMAQVDLGWQDGRRRRKALYGRTKAEVQDKLRETLHRRDHGLPPVPEQETLGSFLRRWLDLKQGQVRQGTWRRYEQIVRSHLLPSLERIRLARLTPQDVAACLRRVETSASAYTARGAREVLRSALNQALRWELVSRNVAALTDAPRHRARQIQPLTPEQAATLLDARRGPPARRSHHGRCRPRVAAGRSPRPALGARRSGDRRAGRPANARARRPRAALRRAEDRTEPPHHQPARRRDRGAAPASQAPARGTPRRRRPVGRLGIGVHLTHRYGGRQERPAEGLQGAAAQGRAARYPISRPCGTPPRRCCSLRGSPRGPSWRRSAIRQISLTMNTYSHVMPKLRQDAAAKMDAILSPRRDRD